MDPTATLISIRAIVKQIDKGADGWELQQLGIDLAELVDALDQWMIKGGFLPTQWRSLVRKPE